VDAVVAVNYGSYLSARVVAAVSAFWGAAAACAAIALWAVTLPVLSAVRRGMRAAVLPSIILGAGFVVRAFVIRGAIVDRDALRAAVLLHPAFITAWGIAISATAFVSASRIKGWAWTFYASAAASILAAGGAAYFVGAHAEAFTLVVAPAGLIAFSGAALASLGSRAARAAFSTAATCVLAGAFLAVADRHGETPLGPVSRPVTTAPAGANRPNIIIIVLDAVRADHTTICGYGYPTTPNLERLAKDAVNFTNAMSVDSNTLPAHASLLTGEYPYEHQSRGSRERTIATIERSHAYLTPLGGSHKTLATHLAQAGYRTGAVVANYARLCRQFGLDQGFSFYYDLPQTLIFTPGGSPAYRYGMEAVDRILRRNGKFVQTYWDAGTITRMCENWVRRDGRRPFFLLVNYMDAHYPYSAPAPFDRIDGPGIPYSLLLRLDNWQNFFTRYMRTGEGLTAEILRQAENQYDGGIGYADHWVGRFVRTLRDEGLYENTLIVVTSDHGEFFGEHEALDHGLELYQEGIRVPLVVKYPGQAGAGQERKERVSILDVFATALEAAGLPKADVTAQPLGSVSHRIMAMNYERGMQVKRLGKRAGRSLAVIFEGDYKYILSSDGTRELYNTATDAAESDNLSLSEKGIAERMHGELTALVEGRWPEATPAHEQ